MDIQALEILSNLAAITTKQVSGDAEVVSGDFSRLLNEINTMQSVSDMQEEICKKFNVTLHVVDYACNTTDQTAENFDLAMLDSGKFYGAGNVVISKKSLLRMQTDSRFRQKVYESIEGLGCTSKMTGGIVKSTGVFIHEDGTGGYWTEFDWGDEEDNGKGKKLLISKKPLNEFFQERSNIGYQLTENDIENIMPLMITGYYKKQE